MNPPNSRQLSRRAVLRGTAATLALPWMESLAWATGDRSPLAQSPPTRFAFMMMSNGVSEADWWAKETAAGLELSRTLQPLAPHAKDLLFLENLCLFPDGKPNAGNHIYFTNFLSGLREDRDDAPIAGETIDQALGRTVGRDSAIGALTLGIERPLNMGKGVQINSYTVSWVAPTTPVVPEV